MMTKRLAPPAWIFSHRNDPNDRRLEDCLSQQAADYAGANIVLLGYPEDEGVRRNKGRTGAAQAPDAIRQQLYKLVVPEHFAPALFDLGNTYGDGSLEEVHRRHQDIVEAVLRDGKVLITLGGGNDLSYPDCAGLAAVESDLLAFNIDAHFDVRTDQPRNSGTPYRQLLEEKLLLPENFAEIAYEPFAASETYLRFLREAGVQCTPREVVQREGIAVACHPQLAKEVRAIFWGLDMDVANGAIAPGVSAVNPGGLGYQDLIDLSRLAGSDPRTRIFEITEVNPEYDTDARTCRLAAMVIWHFLDAFNTQFKEINRV
ncbi:MAG TPA: formimidoylglutamase [Calditrichia bacterium]|nr:formimidoylglutamase [Calditrichota bacterium]HQV31150.1 formimidoylglutamase [Calditrichia bacterium]